MYNLLILVKPKFVHLLRGDIDPNDSLVALLLTLNYAPLIDTSIRTTNPRPARTSIMARVNPFSLKLHPNIGIVREDQYRISLSISYLKAK